MVDLSQKTIQQLFYDQVKKVTMRSIDPFEMQCSEWWMK